MKRTRIWSIVLLAIVLTLAACGGDTVPTQTPVSAPATTAPEATAPATSAPTAGTESTATTTGSGQAGGTAGTLNGVTLPPDAAPPDQQVYVSHY
ncbi:MAG: hypothetical protein ACJ78Q_18105, partial [Chloroflexia bacterium]